MAKMFVAGEQVDSESGQTTEVRNPATGEIVDTVPKGTINDVRRAIDVAQSALKKWSTMAPAKRGAILLAAGHTILQQEKELATLLTKEQGKPMRESILEIRRFVHTLDHYGGMAKTMRTSAVMLDTGRHGLVLRKPLGVCGSIVPWNFPVSLMGNKLGPALLAGSSGLPGGFGRAVLSRISRRKPAARVASLFGLAPCGVWPAIDLAADAVRSYRTFSPLPTSASPFGEASARRYIFCATVLQVAPTGRYPAHCPLEFGLSSPATPKLAVRRAQAGNGGHLVRCGGT